MERLRRLASLFETASIHGWELFSGSGVGYAVGLGKLALGIEIGGGGFGNAQSTKWVQQAARGLRSAMQHLEMLPGEPRWPESVVVVTSRAGIRPKHGGYHVPEIDVDALGTAVEAGQVLGRTCDTQSLALLEELRSPHRGLLYMVRPYGPTHPGDWGYIVSDERGQRVYRPGAGA